MGSNKLSSANKQKWIEWLFISPALIIIALFVFYPAITSIYTTTQVGKGAVTHFGGLQNWGRLLKDNQLIIAIKTTLTYLIIQVPVMLVLALIAATLLNDPKLKFRGFFRTAIFLPCVTSLVAYSVLFRILFANTGLMNQFLMSIHVIKEPIGWLVNPFWAKVVVIIGITWRWTGYNMVFYLASLQNVDKSIFEAAEIDGASKVRQFFSIIIPLLKPIILFTAIMSTNGTLQLFDETMNITNGGPGVSTVSISQYIYFLLFRFAPDFGYAATVSYVIVFIVALLSFIQMKVSGGEKDVRY